MRKYDIKLWLFFVISILIFETGCSSNRVAFDRDGVSQSKSIGHFAWNGRPFYSNDGGLGGAIMAIGSGRIKDATSTMYNSGIYAAFENEFTKAINTMMNISTTKLDKYKLEYKNENNKEIDVTSSARSQGFDLIIETTLTPKMYEKTDKITSSSTLLVDVIADVKITRVSDNKIIWSESTSIRSNYKGYNDKCTIYNCDDELRGMAKSAAQKLIQSGLNSAVTNNDKSPSTIYISKELNSSNPSERYQAIITNTTLDSAILSNIVIGDEDSEVRRVAFVKLKDRSFLNKVPIDNEVLTKVALNDQDSSVRIIAVRELKDQAVLSSVVINDKDSNVRKAAISNLEDQAVLTKIVIGDLDNEVRINAIGKLTNQALLEKIATEDTQSSVRYAAIVGLTNQMVLSKIVTSDTAPENREIAATKIIDPDVLSMVATVDKHSDVRKAAIRQIREQSLLEKIATNDVDTDVRCVAIENITNQSILVKFATDDKDIDIRKTALKSLADPALRLKVTVEDVLGYKIGVTNRDQIVKNCEQIAGGSIKISGHNDLTTSSKHFESVETGLSCFGSPPITFTFVNNVLKDYKLDR